MNVQHFRCSGVGSLASPRGLSNLVTCPDCGRENLVGLRPSSQDDGRLVVPSHPRKPKRPPAHPTPPPPDPLVLVQEGFSTFETPDPSSHSFRSLSPGPGVGNGDVWVYRFRVTVERIEEPAEVILERMVEMFRGETNHHRREALAGEAWERFKVNLWERTGPSQ